MTTRISTDIDEACSILKKGGVVAIPTETVYGLAANGMDPNSVIKIFEAKNRPAFNPLILHCSSKQKALDLVSFCPDWAHELMNSFWPGPLTLVLPKLKSVPDIVSAGLPTVAVRVPSHKITNAILENLEFPLAAPSANTFGRTSPTLPSHVFRDLNGRIPLILDGGLCNLGLESTIVGIDENFSPVIYRHGLISQEDIENIVGTVKSKLTATNSPLAPGMMKQHYAPITPSYLVDDLEEILPHLSNNKVGVLAFDKLESKEFHVARFLSESANYLEAAANLYRMMHELDTYNLDLILLKKMPDPMLGRAINDKLERASSPQYVLLRKINK
jgi:L-threonylcarbamoyladenylate synthase